MADLLVLQFYRFQDGFQEHQQRGFVEFAAPLWDASPSKVVIIIGALHERFFSADHT